MAFRQRFNPAAFGRLCVETLRLIELLFKERPAAFGRLCVETFFCPSISSKISPAAFGRLCVETVPGMARAKAAAASRLRAAVC